MNGIEEILSHFFTAPENQRPDIKALARLLRGGEPLPPGIGAWLAEVLDPRPHFRHGLEVNWRLVPDYVGQYDKGQRADEVGNIVVLEIEAARKRGLSIEEAIQQIVADGKIAKSESSLQKIWNKHQRWRRGESATRRFLEKAARKS